MAVRIAGGVAGEEDSNMVFRYFPCEVAHINCKNKGRVEIRVKKKPDIAQLFLHIRLCGTSDPCVHDEAEAEKIIYETTIDIIENQIIACNAPTEFEYLTLAMNMTESYDVGYDLVMEVEIS